MPMIPEQNQPIKYLSSYDGIKSVNKQGKQAQVSTNMSLYFSIKPANLLSQGLKCSLTHTSMRQSHMLSVNCIQMVLFLRQTRLTAVKERLKRNQAGICALAQLLRALSVIYPSYKAPCLDLKSSLSSRLTFLLRKKKQQHGSTIVIRMPAQANPKSKQSLGVTNLGYSSLSAEPIAQSRQVSIKKR